jgi:formate dehydrogenase iron-sulfur subunit
MNRRTFLRRVATAAGAGLTASSLEAEPLRPAVDDVGVLVDTTRCAGCRACEEACAKANGLPVPDIADETVFKTERRRSPSQFSVINRYQTRAGEFFVKNQCMHCLEPACVSACLTKAMHKTKEGPVVWDSSKCMGCRFCMVSCPFDTPKFEYDRAIPRIRKCTMCFTRLEQGKVPACVENCPAEALTFGPRSKLLAEARTRIAASPTTYLQHIYGEHEVGGTSFLYLVGAQPRELGLRTDLGDKPYPELTTPFLYSVPAVLLLGPAFLLAVRTTVVQAGEPGEGED